MLRLLPVMVCLALPLSAQTCPTELRDGVEVGYDDLSIARLTPTGAPGVLREWVLFSEDGEGYEVLAWYGIYTLRTANFNADGELPDTVETTWFEQTPPAPEPGQRVEGVLAEVHKLDQRFQRRHDFIAGDLAALTIGDCLYSAYEAELRVFDAEGAIRLMFSVIPRLGVAILTRSEDIEGVWSYAPLSIAALPVTSPLTDPVPLPAIPDLAAPPPALLD
jgi:hypothetical protein